MLILSPIQRSMINLEKQGRVLGNATKGRKNWKGVEQLRAFFLDACTIVPHIIDDTLRGKVDLVFFC